MAPKKREIIVMVHCRNSKITFGTYNVQSQENESYDCALKLEELSEPNQFFINLREVINLKRIKALVITISFSYFSSFSDSHEFRIKYRDYCAKNDIFFFYATLDSFQSLVAVTQTKTMVKEGEEVMVICADQSGKARCERLIREQDHYRNVDVEEYKNMKVTNEWKKTIMKESKPKKVILLRRYPTTSLTFINQFEKLFKDENCIKFVQGQPFELIRDAIIDKVLHLMGEIINPYDVTTRCHDIFSVELQYEDIFDLNCIELMTTKAEEPLPFEKSICIDADPTKVVMFYGKTTSTSQSAKLLQHLKLATFKTKKIKAILKVDINSICDFQVEPIEELEETFSKLNANDKPEKLRIIFEKENFSVIPFVNGKACNRMNDVDGLDKTPLYISFTKKRPAVGMAAKLAYAEQSKFVVYDLIKLCSITSADVINPKWGFQISVENDSLMVTMQSIHGKTQSSIDFLLALILRDAIKRVFKETGEKVSKIEIQFDGFAPNTTLKKNFIEAGKLMKRDISFC